MNARSKIATAAEDHLVFSRRLVFVKVETRRQKAVNIKELLQWFYYGNIILQKKEG